MHVPEAPDQRLREHWAHLREHELKKGKFRLNKMKQVLYIAKYKFVQVTLCYRLEE